MNIFRRLKTNLQWFIIDGKSMHPTLKPGDLVLVNKSTYQNKNVQRGDIVAFRLDKNKILIKRIIGVPGDILNTFNGNNTPLSEDNYFLEGDNKFDSFDSRKFGPVQSSSIIGKVTISFWPPRLQ